MLYLMKNFVLQVQKLTEDLQRKEAKWGPTITKLQEQVKFLERENQTLHEENHKLKLKTVSSKVRQIQNSQRPQVFGVVADTT